MWIERPAMHIFGNCNAGFDMAITSKTMDGEAVIFLVETRYYKKTSKKETLREIIRKYALCSAYFTRPELKGVKWLYVHAAFREIQLGPKSGDSKQGALLLLYLTRCILNLHISRRQIAKRIR